MNRFANAFPYRRRTGPARAAVLLAAFLSHGLFNGTFADQIWLDKPTGAPIFPQARITRVENNTLFFMVGGNETSREISRIARIGVDDEPALNQAEEAMALEQFDTAVDAYQKVARSSTRPWLRDWAASRLVDASSRSGRFDAASSAYIALVLKDPATAAARKPQLPAKGSTFLDTAVSQANTALSTPRLTDAQTTALLNYLLELHVARQDDAAANAVAARLDEVLARDPANPAAAKANARRKLQAAARLLNDKKYAAAITAVEADGAAFVDPQQQAEALFIIAQARAELAGPDDRTKLADAALAYMRVVAHFKDAPGRPRVAASLLATGAICEQLGDKPAAVELYSQVVGQFADDAAAVASARQSLERLKAP